MTPDELKIKLEENNIPPNVIDEILLDYQRNDDLVVPTGLSLDDRIFLLKNIMENEPDFRKRARIAARIISEKMK